LNAAIPWTARECLRAATVHIGGSLEEIAQAERTLSPNKPFVLLGQPSLFDSSRASSGRHTDWAYCHVPNGSTENYTESIERQIVRFAPEFRGYRQAQNFASPEKLHKDSTQASSAPVKLSLNHWGLSGSWNVNAESAVLEAVPGKIAFRFHSRDLHLVLAPAKDAKPVRFVVRLDGAAPGENCGIDVAPDGSGEIREPRLYQLIRQKGSIVDRTFEIEFLDPGVHALDFTFG
jgi:hypothetical protein